jgi:hypothetical protein
MTVTCKQITHMQLYVNILKLLYVVRNYGTLRQLNDYLDFITADLSLIWMMYVRTTEHWMPSISGCIHWILCVPT